MIIKFEDKGQDFLTWELDEDGRVIDCQPFQGSVWCGKYVFQHKYLETGHIVYISNTPILTLNQPIKEMKYRVLSIEK